MIIDCLSDIHGYFPKLQGGDLLLIAGDVADGGMREFDHFLNWLEKQAYTKKIFIGGNHDNFLYDKSNKKELPTKFGDLIYLCDSGIHFEGLNIWGSPWTKTFDGQNPLCKAFSFDLETQLKDKFELIPADTHILITHSPPYGILDGIDGTPVGSPQLLNKVKTLSKLIIHLFGHIHEEHGVQEDSGVKFINASYVNDAYEPVNEPIRIILQPTSFRQL